MYGMSTNTSDSSLTAKSSCVLALQATAIGCSVDGHLRRHIRQDIGVLSKIVGGPDDH